ncbi:MAG TPA: MFS transporter [Chitinophagales bacterium]
MNKLFARWSAFPKAAPYIVATETAERFSYYGMKAILTTFLVSHFFKNELNAEAHANEVTHFFIALGYLLSIAGGLIADYVLGRYWTILLFSILYCVGHAFLAIFETNYDLFYAGLMLICLGMGGVKPNVSVMVGDQFENEDDKNISALYDLFYMGINVGSLFSMLLIPYLKGHYGAPVAFGVPGVLMAVALLVFVFGTKKYKIKMPSDTKKEASESIFSQLKQVWKVLVVFTFLPVWWALYDQNGSEMVIQAQYMDLHFLGIDWLAEQVQTINALLILVLIPVFAFGIFPALEKVGIKVSALRKIGWGMVIMVFAFAMIAWIQAEIDRGVKLNIGWQLFAYLILTISEIMVSITGLEYSFSNSPKMLKSTIMAIFFFTVFLGNMLVVKINQSIQEGGFFSHYKGANYFWVFTGIMAVNAVLFYAALYVFKIKDKQND